MAFYRIKLTPVETYFFGGEKHEATGEAINYFTVSENLPQQSTIFGFMRYCLLYLKGLLNSGKQLSNEAKKLIGEKGFDISSSVLPESDIKSISNLYLCKENETFVIAPIDYGFTITQAYNSLLLKNGDDLWRSKKGTFELAVTSVKSLANNHNSYEKLKDLICVIETVGNEKTTGEDRDEKFYVQHTKRLAKGWAFMFECELNTTINTPTVLLLPLGGEKKLFRTEIESIEKLTEIDNITFKGKLSDVESQMKLYGLYSCSDSIIDINSLPKPDLSISECKNFRYFSSVVSKTSNYYRFSGNNQNNQNYTGLSRSLKYNVLQAGSVFYFKDENKRDAAYDIMTANKQYQAIGFNKVIRITAE